MKFVFRTCGLIILGFVLFFIPNSLPEATPLTTTESCPSIGNPAAAYCQTIMGYSYEIVTGADGSQNGICAMPDTEVCDQWDFYAGTCGKAYSWCEQAGYKLETRQDGKDPYAFEYSTCVDNEGHEVGTTASLSGLSRLDAPGKTDIFSLGSAVENPSPQVDHGVPPASIDWRNYLGQNWVTPVKDQATCGSCWAFSAVGVAESSHNIIASNPNLDLDLSEQYLVSTCYTGGDCGGGLEYNALGYIKTNGVTDEACYPYLSANSLCSARCADWGMRLKFVPNNHTDLSYTGTDMKNLISSYGPITIALGYGTDFGGGFDGSRIYRCTNDTGSGGSDGANHAVVAVGYNDAGGYWIAKNSWGSTWEDSGYFKIGYNECNVETSGIAWVETSLPTLNKVFLPLIVKGGSPSQVLWSQAISGADTNAYANQDFETDFDDFDIYIADDFIVPAGGWNIKEIFVPGNIWNAASPSLANANHLVFQIYTNNAGTPLGYPGGGSPLWSLSLLPTNGQITLSTGLGGSLTDVTLKLTSPLNLSTGTYWLVFYPEMAFSTGGQYGRHVSDTTNGYDAMVINPDGGFGFPVVWTSIQSESTWSMVKQDMAFEIRGNP